MRVHPTEPIKFDLDLDEKHRTVVYFDFFFFRLSAFKTVDFV